jgi:hypothetical protein
MPTIVNEQGSSFVPEDATRHVSGERELFSTIPCAGVADRR